MPRDIDRIIEQVKNLLLEAKVIQEPEHDHAANYDNGIWYFSLPGNRADIQIESPLGECPFVVETNEQSSKDALKASTIEEAVRLIIEYLRAASEDRSVWLEGERYWN